MNAYRSPGYVEPTLTPEEEKKFYASVPLFGAPVNVAGWAVAMVGGTIFIVLAAVVKTLYFP